MNSMRQLDLLGERLREGNSSAQDIRLLDQYRRSFASACTNVAQDMARALERDVATRPAKSTRSIVDKLQRETIRLTQIQDIAGCRVLVDGCIEQDRCIASIVSDMDARDIFDRRRKPSAGYRAVHVVIVSASKRIEVQVRTRLQHRWAEASEKLSDVLDPRIKYGGGPVRIREALDLWSNRVMAWEQHLDTLASTASAVLFASGIRTEQGKIEAELRRLAALEGRTYDFSN